MSVNKDIKRVTTHTLHKMKEMGEKISMLTAYDFSLPESSMKPELILSSWEILPAM